MKALLELAWTGAGRFLPAFSSRFSSTLLSFLVLLAASHFLPTQEYGLYVFLFSIGSALGLIAVLGQQILVVKHYRRTEASGHPLNQALLGVNARWLALGCFALLAAALPLWLFAEELPPTYRYLWLAFVFAAIFALSEYLQNYFRIHGRINMSLVPREIVWRGSSILCIGAAGLAGMLVGGAGAMAIVTGLLAATTLYQCVCFLHDEGLSWLKAREQVPAETHGEWRRESGYFIANNVLNSASAYLETILIGVLIGLDQAGFYFVALRISMLLLLPLAAIDTVGIPMIAARFQKSDTAGAQLLIGRLSFASFCISLLGALALAVVAPFILHLFNPEFVQHENVLVALCVLSVSLAFFGPGSWLLMIGGGERFFLIARAIMFVIYLGLLYGLARIGGLMGIAIAGLIFNTASSLAAWYWIKQKWRIDNMATAFFRPFLFGGAPADKTAPPPTDRASEGAGR
ncbi:MULTISPECIES: lipopolysaccharide biosynthesis protein [unclassified Bosea (in: a-proteobacteria)]|uniref:lipopolysaccharide biosynthesis protein n=1 Tax=unclassified Bosea (in: a-proteobacteria) TaxID=2653178 RepID=UPI000F7636D5|nr:MULTISPECIES: lipopolysaccharide biosynthesis protein [unclassified Bosea (in: a-proteobacteria)]AZO80154.1 polysaccharide biosynthesis associate [Bosea sp. Tri-49]RXT22942.1 polysaccharide biosynthesis associate [Bosea sp. Tri-39]RXT38412.1 polysaccharide biosynthesis associate [Bosea sp. Tri-54]